MNFSQLLKLSIFAIAPFLCFIEPLLARETNNVVNNHQVKAQLKPSTRAADLLAQETRSTAIKITGVKLNPTEGGIEVVLESDRAGTSFPITRTEGNTFIAELKNVVLALPEEPGFQTANPVAGIASVSVMQLDATTVSVSVIGTEATPTATIRVSEPTVAEQPTEAESEEGEEEIIATGEKETGYRASNASTATKTDTPLRDIPQSIHN